MAIEPQSPQLLNRKTPMQSTTSGLGASKERPEASIPDSEASERMERSERIKAWFKRIGVAGFLFFLLKGLAWIAVWVFGVKTCQNLGHAEGTAVGLDHPQVATEELAAFEGFDDPILMGFVFQGDEGKTLGTSALFVADHHRVPNGR
jgi:hypothetical protein